MLLLFPELVLLICFIAGAVADLPAAAVEELFQFQSPTQKVLKQTTNEKSRLIFVAGLEGTGHHAWSDMFKECINLKKCEVEYNLTQTLMHFDHVKHIVHGLFGAIDAPFNALQIHKAMEIVQALAQRPGNHVYLMGLCFVHLSAMMSYPNYNGVNKAVDHPDISILATIAEWAGLDFRVIVLQRDAEDILKSTARRGIGGREEPKILLSNAAVLLSQLLLLDRKFYHCIQYHSLGKLDPQSKHKLVNFLHPTLLGPIIDRMLAMVVYSESNRTTVRPSDRNFQGRTSSGVRSGNSNTDMNLSIEVRRVSEKYHAWQLAQRLHQIDELCQH